MTRRPLARLATSAPKALNEALHAAFIVGAYTATSILLDWISFFQVLPGTCFTPWNPPPAASLALLVLNGLRFAPSLFMAGVTSDTIVVGCPFGITAAVTTEAMTVIGYTGVAAALRRFAYAERGLSRATDVFYLLLIAGAGTFAVASLAVYALVMMSGLPANLGILRGLSLFHWRFDGHRWPAPRDSDHSAGLGTVEGGAAECSDLRYRAFCVWTRVCVVDDIRASTFSPIRCCPWQ